MGSPRLKIHTPCAHEPILGRAVLLRNLNAKAARQRRPTNVVSRFRGRNTPKNLWFNVWKHRDCHPDKTATVGRLLSKFQFVSLL